jgi:hypothetical protein
LNDKDVDIISALCIGHRVISLQDPRFETRYDHLNRPIRVQLLAGLLRIADELDMTYTRAPSRQRMLMEVTAQFDPIARIHWMKHYYTESVSFSLEKTVGQQPSVKINIDLRGPDKTHLQQIEKQIKDRLLLHLDGLPFKEYGFTLELSRIKHKENPALTNSVLHKRDVRILYIDDDEMQQSEVVNALKSSGFVHCDTVENSNSASAKLIEVAGNPTGNIISLFLISRCPISAVWTHRLVPISSQQLENSALMLN